MATAQSPRSTQSQFSKLVDRTHTRAAYDLYVAWLVHERDKEHLPDAGAPLRKRAQAALKKLPSLQYDALPLMRQVVLTGGIAGAAAYITYTAAVATGLSVTTAVYAAVTLWFVSRVRQTYREDSELRAATAKAATDVVDKVNRAWESQEIYDDTVKNTRSVLAPVLGTSFDVGGLINEVDRLPIEQVLQGASPLRRAAGRRVGLGVAEAEAAAEPSRGGDGSGGSPAPATTTGAPAVDPEAKVATRSRPWLTRPRVAVPAPPVADPAMRRSLPGQVSQPPRERGTASR